MDEAEWLSSGDTVRMLALVKGAVRDRTLRLWACGCCRRVWPLLADARSRAAVEAAESYADGLTAPEGRRRVAHSASCGGTAANRGGTGASRAGTAEAPSTSGDTGPSSVPYPPWLAEALARLRSPAQAAPGSGGRGAGPLHTPP
jgi:hypothetical protein